MKKSSISHAIEVFRRHGYMMRTQQALREGIAPRTLYEMRDRGLLTMLNRGLFRLADAPRLAQPDLAHVAMIVPKGVVCLISALAFHNLTNQIPHRVYLALPTHSEKPRLQYPPLALFWLSGEVFSAGIEVHQIDQIPVRIYGREKTVADCFKFRNKIGLDVAREALQEALRRGCRVEVLLQYARIDRVDKIMQTYLESML